MFHIVFGEGTRGIREAIAPANIEQIGPQAYAFDDDLDEDRESFESTVKNLQKKLKGDFVIITPQYWGGRGSKALAEKMAGWFANADGIEFNADEEKAG